MSSLLAAVARGVPKVANLVVGSGVAARYFLEAVMGSFGLCVVVRSYSLLLVCGCYVSLLI